MTTRSARVEADEVTALRHVVDSLYAEFGDRATRDSLHHAVEDEHRRWSDAPVKDFVPILVERRVRGRLRAAGSYSWMRPPSRSRRTDSRQRDSSEPDRDGDPASGLARPRARCGRWVL